MRDAAAATPTGNLQPIALRLDNGSRSLALEWTDGSSHTLAYRTLRERCRCAECRSLAQRGIAVETSANVSVIEVAAYGPNAVQLVFSDGHSRGIFPFAYLRELALDARPPL